MNTFDRKVLLDALRKAGKIVPKNSPKPILESVRIITCPAGAFVHATDLQAFLVLRIDEQEREDARFLVPCRELIDFLRKSKAKQINLRFDQGYVYASDDFVEVKLESGDEQSYPTFDSNSGEYHIDVMAEDLAATIDQTTFAAEDEDSRYALSNVHFEFEDSLLRLVATDGKRIAVSGVGATTTGKEPEGLVLIRAGYLNFLRSLIQRKKPKRPAFRETGESVMVHVSGSMVRFCSESADLAVRLSDGRFPKWRDIVPSGGRPEVTFNRAVMAAALELAGQFTDDEHCGVSFCVSEEEILLHGEFPKGVFEQKIPALSPNSFAAVTVILDPELLLEYLKHESFDKIRMDFENAKRIVGFSGNSRYFLMPLTKDRK